MERATQKDERGYYLVGDGVYSDWGVPEKFRGDDVDRLAACEAIQVAAMCQKFLKMEEAVD